MYGHKCLIVIQGRPPVCLKCEEVGRLRGESTNYRYGKNPTRSYASVKQAKEVVSKPQVQDNKAVSKPITGDEVVGRPQHDETEDAVGMPIYGNDQATVEKSPEKEEIAN